MNLDNIPTSALAEELSKREGVEMTYVPPYEDVEFTVNGSAFVLIVVD